MPPGSVLGLASLYLYSFPLVISLTPVALSTIFMLMTPEHVAAAQTCPLSSTWRSETLWLRLHGCKTKFWLSPLNPFSFQLVDPDTPNCTSQKLGNHLTSSLSPSSPSACLINSTIHTSQVSSLLFVCISPLNYYHFSTGKLLKFPNWSFCFHFCLLYTVLLTGGTMFYEKHNHIM